MPAPSNSTLHDPDDLADNLLQIREEVGVGYKRQLGDGATLWHAANILRTVHELRAARDHLLETVRALVAHHDELEEDCYSCHELFGRIADTIPLAALTEAVTPA